MLNSKEIFCEGKNVAEVLTFLSSEASFSHNVIHVVQYSHFCRRKLVSRHNARGGTRCRGGPLSRSTPV